MTQRRMALRALWIVCVSGCSFHASCGGKTVDSKKGEAAIVKMLATSGLDATVSCPTGIKAKQGDTFDCTAVVGGATGKVKVTQKDDKGAVEFELVEGFLIGAKLEGVLVDRIQQQYGVAAKVTCGAPFRASVPGETFTCSALAPDGDTLTIGITVKDKLGAVDFKIAEPAGGAAPPAADDPAPAADDGDEADDTDPPAGTDDD
ncbi:MAG: DUF4333 domain-containing protein [Myxococcales bacterium]|nr:DUF4333 domain-containing protein [Myxococcales bacterium]